MQGIYNAIIHYSSLWLLYVLLKVVTWVIFLEIISNSTKSTFEMSNLLISTTNLSFRYYVHQLIYWYTCTVRVAFLWYFFNASSYIYIYICTDVLFIYRVNILNLFFYWYKYRRHCNIGWSMLTFNGNCKVFFGSKIE